MIDVDETPAPIAVALGVDDPPWCDRCGAFEDTKRPWHLSEASAAHPRPVLLFRPGTGSTGTFGERRRRRADLGAVRSVGDAYCAGRLERSASRSHATLALQLPQPPRLHRRRDDAFDRLWTADHLPLARARGGVRRNAGRQASRLTLSLLPTPAARAARRRRRVPPPQRLRPVADSAAPRQTLADLPPTVCAPGCACCKFQRHVESAADRVASHPAFAPQLHSATSRTLTTPRPLRLYDPAVIDPAAVRRRAVPRQRCGAGSSSEGQHGASIILRRLSRGAYSMAPPPTMLPAAAGCTSSPAVSELQLVERAAGRG